DEDSMAIVCRRWTESVCQRTGPASSFNRTQPQETQPKRQLPGGVLGIDQAPPARLRPRCPPPAVLVPPLRRNRPATQQVRSRSRSALGARRRFRSDAPRANYEAPRSTTPRPVWPRPTPR
ncbi:hypothetical protein NBCG_00940, partial [Nocardioidaceae bacterium Broad-1]